ADRFREDQAGGRGYRPFEASRVPGMNQSRADAKARQRVGEEIERSAIERRGSHDMPPLPHQGGDRKEERSMARRRGEPGNPSIEGGDPFLQHRDRRITQARIEIAGLLQIEERRGMVAVAKDIGGCLVDRHGPGAGDRVRALPRVQGEGIEFWKAGLCHATAPSRTASPEHSEAALSVQPEARGSGNSPQPPPSLYKAVMRERLPPFPPKQSL